MKTTLFFVVEVLFIGAMALIGSNMSALSPQTEWRVLVDKTKSGQISVPPDWEVRSSSPTAANSRDHKLDVGIYVTDMGKTLSESKASFELMHPPIKVFEDSQSRLWFSHKDPFPPEGSRWMSYFVAIPVKENICVAEIGFENGKLAPIAKLIAKSVVAAK